MAAFTRETQVGTSAEIVDAYFAWIQSPASSISIRGATLEVVATILSSSTLCPFADGVLIPEWQAHLVDSFEALERGRRLGNISNDWPNENLPL